MRSRLLNTRISMSDPTKIIRTLRMSSKVLLTSEDRADLNRLETAAVRYGALTTEDTLKLTRIYSRYETKLGR